MIEWIDTGRVLVKELAPSKLETLHPRERNLQKKLLLKVWRHQPKKETKAMNLPSTQNSGTIPGELLREGKTFSQGEVKDSGDLS